MVTQMIDTDRWTKTPDDSTIEDTVANLKRRGIDAEVLDTSQEALDRLIGLIPRGAELMEGASQTLEQIGFMRFLNDYPDHFINFKTAIMEEKDHARQMSFRRHASIADYWTGSVHAIAKTGEIVIASATGSQLGGYVYGASHVVWVAGYQKITETFVGALERVREYSFPKEDQRQKSLGKSGSHIGKLLIINDDTPSRTRLLLVKEQLGF